MTSSKMTSDDQFFLDYVSIPNLEIPSVISLDTDFFAVSSRPSPMT